MTRANETEYFVLHGRKPQFEIHQVPEPSRAINPAVAAIEEMTRQRQNQPRAPRSAQSPELTSDSEPEALLKADKYLYLQIVGFGAIAMLAGIAYVQIRGS